MVSSWKAAVRYCRRSFPVRRLFRRSRSPSWSPDSNVLTGIWLGWVLLQLSRIVCVDSRAVESGVTSYSSEKEYDYGGSPSCCSQCKGHFPLPKGLKCEMYSWHRFLHNFCTYSHCGLSTLLHQERLENKFQSSLFSNFRGFYIYIFARFLLFDYSLKIRTIYR